MSSETKEMIDLLSRASAALDTPSGLTDEERHLLQEDINTARNDMAAWRDRPVLLRPPEMLASHMAAIIKAWDDTQHTSNSELFNKLHTAINAARPYAVAFPTVG